MKTPWSKLLQYGTGVAAIIVMTICGVILLTVVAAAVALSKILIIIK